jgi:hypothetical protein
MRSSRNSSLSGLIAAAGLMAMASSVPGATAQRASVPPPTRRHQPVMKTAQDREIADWNAAIEAKRQAKKGRKP